MNSIKQHATDASYLAMAFMLALQSKCQRKKLACLLVRTQANGVPHIVSDGVNGTLPGEPNICELETGETAPDTVHAEINCLRKIDGGDHYDYSDCTAYITLQPCLPCAEELVRFGVGRVVYCYDYKCQRGVEHLESKGVEVKRITPRELHTLTGVYPEQKAFDYSGWLRDSRGLSEAEINAHFAHIAVEEEDLA